MSLDIDLFAMRNVSVWGGNITHNLTAMASEAGIYKHIWRPEEIGIIKAKQLIKPLQDALTLLRGDRARFEKHNPDNGWGDYSGFVGFVSEYLTKCQENPDATIEVSR